MKRIVVLLLVFALSIAACSQPPAIDIPDGSATPDYSDAERIKPSYAWLPSFAEGGLEHYDWEVIVADVTINGWLDEITDYLTSYYSASVNNVLYGKLPRDTIVIEKTGNTKYKDGLYPLMEQNERLIVIIVKNPDAWLPYEKYTEQTGEEPPEWMQETVVYSLYEYCDVVEHENELYVLERTVQLAGDLSSDDLKTVDEQLRKELVSDVRNKFSETKSFAYPRAYRYDDFVALVNKFA